MRVLYWNVRGIGNFDTGGRLKDLVNKHKVEVIGLAGLAEPMIDLINDFVQRVGLPGFHFELLHNSTTERQGNIWVLKRIGSQVQVMAMSTQQITISISGCLCYFCSCSC
ncbi:hypothetical protein AQUCO_00100761v1 [Aquilegia coerulea]|uniref:Endonuclease/exonuclease/phosphatase domain-containing protein n=1 Tax=Aquilegia coerulea TaxID=218851 RepID=A0A2G5FBU4_AQUCA|nr:hypothetical protein AQUCO_00100761v1 [Aquilegia coerulea]